MRDDKSESKLMHEFAEFVDAKPVAPLKSTEAAILGMVERDLRPALWRIFSKATLVQVAAGLATLTICPQFGVGFGHHNELLHTLHLYQPGRDSAVTQRQNIRRPVSGNLSLPCACMYGEHRVCPTS